MKILLVANHTLFRDGIKLLLKNSNILSHCREADELSFALDILKTETFDLIILDPPAFAKHLSARHRAIQAYRRINAYAFSQIAPGGIVFTFSCSQAVTADLFRGAILAAGIDAKRNIRILHQLTQPPDHPINPFHPESEYLKGFVLAVE